MSMSKNTVRLFTWICVVLVLLSSISGLAAPVTTPSSGSNQPSATFDKNETEANTTTISSAGACKPENTEQTGLGWVSSCHYTDMIQLSERDEFDRFELKRLAARTMARVEVVRQLDFKEQVSIEVISRGKYMNRTADQTTNISTDERRQQNIVWEAAFMIDGRTDATQIERTTRSASISGYYRPSQDRVVYISDNKTHPTIDEVRLSKLLVHALQDQHFDTPSEFDLENPRYSTHLNDTKNGVNGFFEGDAVYVQKLYQDRCTTNWSCQRYDQQRSDDTIRKIHYGIDLLNRLPHFEGHSYVSDIYNHSGWAGVNAKYDRPPRSSSDLIHSGLRTSHTAEIEITDKSDDSWQLVVRNGSLGEAGVSSMLMYPQYKPSVIESSVFPSVGFYNYNESGEIVQDNPITFERNKYSKGFEDDELYGYVHTSQAATGQEYDVRNGDYWIQNTGYVWKSKWNTSVDSQKFVDGYIRLLQFYDATEMDGYDNVYRIPSGTEFAGVYHVNQSDNVVTVTKAPTVDALPRIRSDISPELLWILYDTWYRNALFLVFVLFVAAIGTVILRRSRRVISE